MKRTLSVRLDEEDWDNLASIIRKLSASDRTRAVFLAIRQGHIRPENNAGRQ